MWIPQSYNDIQKAIKDQTINESESLDVKRSVPDNKSESIAIDICAMTVEGGVIIYGIDEDKENGRFLSLPILLKGQKERISQIVQNYIFEKPEYSIKEFPVPEYPEKGYLVIIIPPSERVPHMVQAKSDKRYYGRSDSINVCLSEAQVAQLYARRERIEEGFASKIELLDKELYFNLPGKFGILKMFSIPLTSRDTLLQDALSRYESSVHLFSDLTQTSSKIVKEKTAWESNWGIPYDLVISTDGYNYLPKQDDPSRHQFPQKFFAFHNNGMASLLVTKVAYSDDDQKFYCFHDTLLFFVYRFIALNGYYLTITGYSGKVLITFKVDGVKGALPFIKNSLLSSELVPYPDEVYQKSTSIMADVMAENYKDIAIKLTKPFFDALTQKRIDPYS